MDKIADHKSGESFDTQKLSAFFKYIIDFKLGQKTSYIEKKSMSFLSGQHRADAQSTSQSSKCHQNRISTKNTLAFSTPSYKGSYILKNNKQKFRNCLIQASQPKQVIHYGYCCDNCFTDPIVGNRYHCQLCDFDLCTECYKNQQFLSDELRHEHSLTLVIKNHRTSESIKQAPNTNNLPRFHLKLKTRLTKSSNLDHLKA